MSKMAKTTSDSILGVIWSEIWANAHETRGCVLADKESRCQYAKYGNATWQTTCGLWLHFSSN